MSLLAELQRRNVIRVAVLYIVTAWLVIQVAETLLPIFNVPDATLRIVVFVLVIGFIPAVIFSWVYELTPEGVKREKDVVRDESITHLTAKRLDIFTIVVVLIGVGFLVGDRYLGSASERPENDLQEAAADAAQSDPAEASENPADSAAADKTSIAVLPFVNMSAEAENEFFSDGISEELLNMLVKLPDLRVASRTSAFSFKGKDVDIPTVARTLNVQHIVEGSVRRSGDQVRITAQLIDVDTDSHLWSDTYTRTMDDIFVIQDEIAGAIAEALKMKLIGDAVDATDHATDNVDAFENYLLGRYYFHQRTAESLPKAIELFEQVITLDPQYAAAYSGLADAYLLLWQYGDFDMAEAVDRAHGYAATALTLDPDLAEAHASMGLATKIRREADTALKHYDRAIELNPSYSMTYVWKGNALLDSNLHAALAAFRAGERVDPLHPLYPENIGSTLLQMGRVDEAEAALRKGFEQHPDTWLVGRSLAEAVIARSHLAEGHRLTVELAERHPESTPVLMTLVSLELRLGRLEAADSWIRYFREVAPSSTAIGFLEMQRLLFSGALEEALAANAAFLDSAPALFAPSIRRNMGYLHLRLGNPQSALDVLESLVLEALDPETHLSCRAYQALAHSRLDRPEVARRGAEQVLELAARTRERGFSEPWLFHVEGLMLGILGRVSEAEERIEAAYALGYRLPYIGDPGPWLDEWLSDSERYRAVKRDIAADIERQLVLIEATQS